MVVVYLNMNAFVIVLVKTVNLERNTLILSTLGTDGYFSQTGHFEDLKAHQNRPWNGIPGFV